MPNQIKLLKHLILNLSRLSVAYIMYMWRICRFTKSNKLDTWWWKATFSSISTKSHCQTPHRVTWCIWLKISTFWWQDKTLSNCVLPKSSLVLMKDGWVAAEASPQVMLDPRERLLAAPAAAGYRSDQIVCFHISTSDSTVSSDSDLIQPLYLLLSVCHHIWLTCQLTLLPVTDRSGWLSYWL